MNLMGLSTEKIAPCPTGNSNVNDLEYGERTVVFFGRVLSFFAQSETIDYGCLSRLIRFPELSTVQIGIPLLLP